MLKINYVTRFIALYFHVILKTKENTQLYITLKIEIAPDNWFISC